MSTQSSNPKRALGRLKAPLQYIPPIAIILESVVMGLGARKYGPFNWNDSPVDCSTYYEAALRHLMAWFTGEDIDDESGVSHLAHVRACMGIILDAEHTGNLIDDRPNTTAVGPVITALAQAAAEKQKPGWAESIAAEAVAKAEEVERKQLSDFTKIDWDTSEPKLMYNGVALPVRDWIIQPKCECPGCVAAFERIREDNRYDGMSLRELEVRQSPYRDWDNPVPPSRQDNHYDVI